MFGVYDFENFPLFLKQLNNNFNFNLANSEFKSQNLCIKAVTTFLTSWLTCLHSQPQEKEKEKSVVSNKIFCVFCCILYVAARYFERYLCFTNKMVDHISRRICFSHSLEIYFDIKTLKTKKYC